MTTSTSTRAAVRMLTLQALVFGVMMALLLVTGNALFLNTYGSEWLPLTYIAVAVAGVVISSVMARAVGRHRLVTVATVVLGLEAVLLVAAWIALLQGQQWVSALLVVLFPLAIQIGFVFLGGQAGQLLDIRELKELFPRIVSGFAFGFLAGGLIGAPLLSVLGSTEQLLAPTALMQLAFLGLVVLTDRRHGKQRSASPTDQHPDEAPAPRRPVRALLASPLVLAIIGYQVLSAVGTQLTDFVFFDRAANRYPDPDDLTRFLSWYTAALNLIDVVFLAVLAGPLLRRFGLRLGLLANPVVVGGAMVVMAILAGGPGSLGIAFLALSSAARIADVSLTDGTTRTSINATYQVLPVDDRLSVQATVEGAGVPIAIGMTGVLLLALQILPGGITVVVTIAAVVCAAWTVVAWFAHREYGRGLRQVILRRTYVDDALDLQDDDDASSLARLLASDDTRTVALGLDLLAGLASPATDTELKRLLDDEEPNVRLAALAELADPSGAAVLRRADAASAISALDDDGDLSAPATLRVLRACRSLPADVAVDRLLRHVDHPDRTVGLVVLNALAAARPPMLPELDSTLHRIVDDDIEQARRILTARRELALPAGAALVRALDEELSLLQHRVAAVLAIRIGDVASRAARTFSDGDQAARALALETLEQSVPRIERRCLTVIRPDLDDDGRLAALGGPVVGSENGWLEVIASDPDTRWRSEWVSMCALHAQRSELDG
jgi:hypothetical protein